MHVTLRRYAEVGARMYEMVFRKVEAGLVPRLKGQPGFRLYCAFLSEEGEGVSVTVFDDREQAARANGQVRGWGQANLRDLPPDRPKVFAGECGIAEVFSREQRADQGQPPIVVVREFADLGPVEETRDVVRRHTLPLITGSPGFRAVYMFRDEQKQSRGATVALFNTREDARRSHERSLQVLREEAADGMAWPPPRVGIGRAIVFATAD